MQLVDAIQKRRCVRKFKDKEVNEKDILDILACSLNAPCAGGIFSVKIVVVNDKEKKNQIAEACLGQDFIAKAPYLLVVCSEGAQTKRMYGKFAPTYLKQQAGAAIQNMFLRITDLKLSTCWIGAFDDNVIKRVLNISPDVDIEAVLPVGYANEEPDKKVLPSLNNVLRHNSFKTKPYKVKKKLET